MKETFILNSNGVNRISDCSFDSFGFTSGSTSGSTSGFTSGSNSGSSARCSGISDSSSDSIFGRTKSRPRPGKNKTKVKGQLRSSSNSSGVESDRSSSDWGPAGVSQGHLGSHIQSGHTRIVGGNRGSPEVTHGSGDARTRPPGAKDVKCCIVGDEGVGKTALVVSYLNNGYPDNYTPTVHDCYTVQLTVEEAPFQFELFDTAGQDHFSVLRRLSYPEADVFMICFSIIDPFSFKRIQSKWIKEIHEYSPNTPIILIGTKQDQRNNINSKILLNRQGMKPITFEQGESLSKKIGAKQYIECSALTQKSLKEGFDAAIISGMSHRMSHHREFRNPPEASSRLSDNRWLRKSIRRLSFMRRKGPKGKNKKSALLHRNSSDSSGSDQSDSSMTSSDSAMTSSSATSSSVASVTSSKERYDVIGGANQSTYSKTFDPDRIGMTSSSQISLKNQIRSIMCFG